MLKRLKEYKEFILILVVFLGGVFWLYRDFVTKERLADAIDDLTAQNDVLISEIHRKNEQLQAGDRQQTCWDGAAFIMFKSAMEVSASRARLHQLRIRHLEQKSRQLPEDVLQALQAEIDQLEEEIRESEKTLKHRMEKAGNWATERCALGI